MRAGPAIATFADWWVTDEAGTRSLERRIMGVGVALGRFHDHIRRLNQEAGKMVHYGGATEDEAIRMVTQSRVDHGVDDRTGSIDVGKDDLVLWNGTARPMRAQ